MSEIFEIYHASNLVNILTSIIHSFKTEQLSADQSNAIKITSNAFAFNVKFDILNTIMRNFISRN